MAEIKAVRQQNRQKWNFGDVYWH